MPRDLFPCQLLPLPKKTAADISIITDAELLAPIRFPHRNMVFSANSSKPVSMQHKSIPIATLNSIYKIVWMDIVGKPPNYLPTISMSVLQMTKKKTAVQSMIAVFGQNITACEVWRFIRDNAWNALTSKDNAEYMSRVNAWHDISNIFDFTQSNSVEDNRYQNVRHRAEELLPIWLPNRMWTTTITSAFACSSPRIRM